MARDRYDGSSDDDDLSSLSELLSFAKQKGVAIVAKLSSETTAEKTVDYITDGNSASSLETRVDDSQD